MALSKQVFVRVRHLREEELSLRGTDLFFYFVSFHAFFLFGFQHCVVESMMRFRLLKAAK